MVGSPASRTTVRHSSYVPSVPGQCDCHVTPVAQWLPCAATSAVLSVAADGGPNRSGVNAGAASSKRLFARGPHLLPPGGTSDVGHACGVVAQLSSAAPVTPAVQTAVLTARASGPAF